MVNLVIPKLDLQTVIVNLKQDMSLNPQTPHLIISSSFDTQSTSLQNSKTIQTSKKQNQEKNHPTQTSRTLCLQTVHGNNLAGSSGLDIYVQTVKVSYSCQGWGLFTFKVGHCYSDEGLCWGQNISSQPVVCTSKDSASIVLLNSILLTSGWIAN